MNRRRLALVLSVLLVLLLAAAGLAVQVGAHAIVDAPNRGRPAPPPRPGELRIAVGPPAAELAVEIVDAAAPRDTVVLLHGIRAQKELLRGWAERLAAAGHRAVLVDLRGHGRSTGDWLSYGVIESADLAQVLDHLRRHGRVVGPVAALGISYGAATAIEWAARDPRLAAVVALAPFASLEEVVPGYAPAWMPGLLVRRAIARAGALAGFDPAGASPRALLPHIDTPLLLVHGRRDVHIPPRHSERLLAARPAGTTLHLLDDADHNTLPLDPRILTFLADTLAHAEAN